MCVLSKKSTSSMVVNGNAKLLPVPTSPGMVGCEMPFGSWIFSRSTAKSFLHRLAVSTKLDLVNRFEASQITLGIITLDDETVLIVVHDEVANVGARWIKRVEVTLPGILLLSISNS